MPAAREQITEWMQRASSGDDEAFGSLASAVQDDLFRFGLAFGLKHQDAAEMTQEVLLRAYRRRKRWTTGSDALAWLYGMAMNVARELTRKARRKGTLELNLDVLSLPVTDAEGNAEVAERTRLLTVALRNLPARQAEAITCRFLRQMSVKDTARVMGCAEGTVKAAVFAGLEKLRKAMAEKP